MVVEVEAAVAAWLVEEDDLELVVDDVDNEAVSAAKEAAFVTTTVDVTVDVYWPPVDAGKISVFVSV